jgi:signal transduction histidine kinase
MRLLNRTLLNFLIYSVLVLLIVTPVFYWVVNRIIIERVDETLQIQKKEIESRIQKIKSENDLKLWEDLDGEVVIEPATKISRDSIYDKMQFNSFSNEMEPYRVLKTFISFHGKPYRLVAHISLVESEDLIKALATLQLIVLTILLSGLLIINWWISKRIWQPFYHTLDVLKKFEIEKAPDLKLESSSIKEFEDLNRAIKQLTERDYQVYLQQKEFTENAAHEMQTPLAVFQSKLELLLQTPLTAQQALMMESLLDATDRLAKLNKALLLLSKIENRQFVETEQIIISEFTSKLISLYKPEADVKEITITSEFKTDLTISFNATLLDVLLSNLISNAIRHGNSKSIIQISISDGQWQIQNEGPLLTFAQEKIFDRFQKGNSASSRTGLGLAIVKKICDIAGFKLSYQSEATRHIFLVDFTKL